MGKKKKPFIDKKTAHSFQVVHRSQRDPLQADQDSSRHVLVPLNTEAQESSKDGEQGSSKEERKEELTKFGIDFEDDYDYFQHLKTRTDCTLEPLPSNVTVIEAKKPASKEFGDLKLPSEAFPSVYEEEEGLLNLAAPAPGPHPEWDPDIVAALDGDFDPDDPDNELEDDFILKANNPVSEDMDSDDDLIRSDDDDDDGGGVERYFPSDEGEDFENNSEGSGFTFGDEETKSRFTNYSMTSSVIRRNEGLTLLDDRFEKVMEEYDEDEIGALDHEEMAGNVNPDSELLNSLVDDYEKKVPKVRFADMECDDKAVRHEAESSDEESGNEVVKIDVTPKEQWDCESILSTYSNLYNHPTLIKEPSKAKQIKLSNKTGIPIGVLPTKPTSKNSTDQDEMDTGKNILISGPRTKDEDKEAKINRKKAVKEERRARRVEKKTNKLTFKAERKRQEQSLLNAKAQKGQKL
ncbi:protein LTV1 homolog [Actinia tenebrosa]|uniref:Protein LTV1 homolog n=1 Tax=Actinia tenebrosa TaxID=6105 RepID=A0A6P8HKT3_ACTTE|nr:protein LTV1 homolog [Actinia tenebrosa]